MAGFKPSISLVSLDLDINVLSGNIEHQRHQKIVPEIGSDERGPIIHDDKYEQAVKESPKCLGEIHLAQTALCRNCRNAKIPNQNPGQDASQH